MTSRRELKNYAKQAMSGKYGILILAFVAVQALALISSMISSALFPGEKTIDIVLSYAFTFILTLLINVVAAGPCIQPGDQHLHRSIFTRKIRITVNRIGQHGKQIQYCHKKSGNDHSVRMMSVKIKQVI